VISEKDWQRTVIEAAQALGWRVVHFRPARLADGSWRTPVEADAVGWVDLVLVRERIVFAELKTAQGRTTPAQVAWRNAILAAAGEHYVWRPGDWLEVQAVLRRRQLALPLEDPPLEPDEPLPW
jgi:hypothetical protein